MRAIALTCEGIVIVYILIKLAYYFCQHKHIKDSLLQLKKTKPASPVQNKIQKVEKKVGSQAKVKISYNLTKGEPIE